MRLDGLKIVVTGGMGYVGSHTCKVLHKAGAYVISVDNRHVEQNIVKGVEYITNDYGDPDLWDALCVDEENIKKYGTLDGVVHCAGTSLVGPSVLDPSEYYNNNVVKTIQMLDQLRKLKHTPFVVFSSSAAVYGNADNCAAMIQETDPTVPCNPYGSTKMMIELILEDYDKAYDLRSYCFRYFNAAGADVWDNELGPEPNDTHIIPRIFEAYQNDTVFKLFGSDYDTPDGTCVRDYIHVCDLALAHLKACVDLSEGQSSAVFNLGTNDGYSNQQIIDIFEDIVGKVDVLVKSRREGDPDSLVADASLYYNSTQPQFSDMKTIIESFNDYYNKH